MAPKAPTATSKKLVDVRCGDQMRVVKTVVEVHATTDGVRVVFDDGSAIEASHENDAAIDVLDRA
jgi:hypothetical protein